jgi:hypothetical protein
MPNPWVRSLSPWLTFVTLLVAMLCCAPEASTQQDPTRSLHRLEPGSRVRVLASDLERRPVIGTITSISADTLVLLRSGRPLAVPLSTLEALEVSLGANRLIGARNGAVTGALVLFTLVLASEPGYARDGAPVWLVLGSIPGAAIGAVTARERWLPLPWRDQ